MRFYHNISTRYFSLHSIGKILDIPYEKHIQENKLCFFLEWEHRLKLVEILTMQEPQLFFHLLWREKFLAKFAGKWCD